MQYPKMTGGLNAAHLKPIDGIPVNKSIFHKL